MKSRLFITRLLISISVALLVGFATAVTTAIALAVLGLYLSGHGYTTLDKNMNYAFVSLSWQDIILLTITLFACIIAFIITYKRLAIKHSA